MATKAKVTIKPKPATQPRATTLKTGRVVATTAKTKNTVAAKPAAKPKATTHHQEPAMVTKAKNTAQPKPAARPKATTKISPPIRATASNKAQPVSTGKASTARKTTATAENKKPAAKPAATIPQAVKTRKPVKEDKPRKIKMVRDSFSMPEDDYAQFAALKRKCLLAGIPVKKSELLRAGLICLSKLTDTKLLHTVGQVEILKTGRPAKARD